MSRLADEAERAGMSPEFVEAVRSWDPDPLTVIPDDPEPEPRAVDLTWPLVLVLVLVVAGLVWRYWR